MARLEREHLPLVFSSSKTRAELELIQHELGISQPFICETGGAVFVPRGYFGFNVAPALDVAGYEVVEFGKPYTEVVASLHRAADRLDIAVVGFNDMSVEEVAIDCDLPLLQARLAKLREYSELFRVVDAKPGALPRLFKALRGAGLDCTSRGAYHHLGSMHRDLGVQFLRGLYRRAYSATSSRWPSATTRAPRRSCGRSTFRWWCQPARLTRRRICWRQYRRPGSACRLRSMPGRK